MACLPPRGWSDTSRGEQGPWRLSPAGPSLSWSVVAGASDLRDSATGPLALVMFHGPNRRHPKRHPPEYSSGAVGVPNVTLGSGTSPSLVNGLLVSRRRLGRQGRRCEAPAPKVTRWAGSFLASPSGLRFSLSLRSTMTPAGSPATKNRGGTAPYALTPMSGHWMATNHDWTTNSRKTSLCKMRGEEAS